ncbi:MAG TPA: amidohydrolase [Xanthobacteraceae bacterium]|nr:amidohydrolase [Xanthobacteraceae bacterium]
MRAFLVAALALTLVGATPAMAQTPPADTILVGGKIVTVDDRFTIAEALAIRDRRIVAIGTNAEIEKLKGPQTRTIALDGRTVIPGLIDNHSHWVRAAEHNELRFDGVTTRKRAVALLTERVGAAKPGEWVAVLGGWSEEQFTDEERGFSRAELDAIAPNNPVVLQSVYNHSYLNSAALKAANIDASTANPPGGTIEKDANGALTGLVRGAGGVAFVAAKIPHADQETWFANTRRLVAYLNSLGITAWGDLGGRGMSARHYEPYRRLAEADALNARVFWHTIRQPATPEQMDKVLAEVPQTVPFQGNDYFDHIGWGESTYGPATTNTMRADGPMNPALMVQVRRLADALARQGIALNSHVEMQTAIDAFLEQYEGVNKSHPIKGLRWVYSHLDQVTEAQLDRMKRLGMAAQLHSRPLIQGALMHKIHGDKAWDMPPFRRVQDSGVHWGLGSDATAVTPSNPFYTLSFAVTGKMIGGRHVNRQTITREEALIAHTRSNAYFLFQESNLGSLTRGRYADLLVLDRDYLTVPADEIKDIKPLITMVGGRVVHDAMGK